MQTQSDTVLNVCLHALENLTSGLDRQNDRAETGCEEDDVGSGLSSLRRAFHCNTAISLLERRGIVYTW